jgi:hypothetical protein
MNASEDDSVTAWWSGSLVTPTWGGWGEARRRRGEGGWPARLWRGAGRGARSPRLAAAQPQHPPRRAAAAHLVRQLVAQRAAHGEARDPRVLQPHAVGAHRLPHLIDQPGPRRASEKGAWGERAAAMEPPCGRMLWPAPLRARPNRAPRAGDAPLDAPLGAQDAVALARVGGLVVSRQVDRLPAAAGHGPAEDAARVADPRRRELVALGGGRRGAAGAWLSDN